MYSPGPLFSCGHRTWSIPTSLLAANPTRPTTSTTYPHPCRWCTHSHTQQQEDAIKQRYRQQKADLSATVRHANAATIAIHIGMMEKYEAGVGKADMRGDAADYRRQQEETARVTGELRDLKWKELEEIAEAWREYNELWP